MAGELIFNADRHEYSRDGKIIPSVYQIISPFLRDFSGIPPETMRLKQDWGTKVHRYRAAYDRGEVDIEKVDPLMASYLSCWDAFLIKFGLRGEEQISETPMAAKYDLYAGTLDVIFPVVRTIVELKTAPISAATGAQLAPYAQLAYDNGIIHTEKVKLIECSITDDGITAAMKAKVWDFGKGMNIFWSCYTLFIWRKQNGIK